MLVIVVLIIEALVNVVLVQRSKNIPYLPLLSIAVVLEIMVLLQPYKNIPSLPLIIAAVLVTVVLVE